MPIAVRSNAGLGRIAARRLALIVGGVVPTARCEYLELQIQIPLFSSSNAEYVLRGRVCPGEGPEIRDVIASAMHLIAD